MEAVGFAFPEFEGGGFDGVAAPERGEGDGFVVEFF